MPRLDLPERGILMHTAIGGGICFLVMFVLLDVATIGLERFLAFLGCMGVMAFQESYTVARDLFLFGLVYLPGGFLGGIYVGYNIEENLRVLLVIPGTVGFVAFIILAYFTGYFAPPRPDLLGYVLLPLMGNIIGGYLGGFTMNWPSKEEEEAPEEFEKLTLEIPK